MNFCPECENYLLLKIENTDTNPSSILKYTCNNCGYFKKVDQKNNDNLCVYHNHYNNDKFKLDNIDINFSAQDPTLPRVNNLQCPFGECETNTNNVEPNILYISIDENTKTFMYKCNNCNKTWTNK